MRKSLTVIVAAVVAVILTSACEPTPREESGRPAVVDYSTPSTTAGDPDGPAVDRPADEPSAAPTSSPTGPRRTLPHFPPSDEGASVSAPTEDSAGTWDADTRGNRRYDPDRFNCETMGNGTCDPGGIPVNGPDGLWHDGLPCYLDFPDMAMTNEQYVYAHARHCSPAR